MLASNCNKIPETPNGNANPVFKGLESYCSNGPKSCKDTLITVVGYLDEINITCSEFFLSFYSKRFPTISNAFDNFGFIEVYYLESNLTQYSLKISVRSTSEPI